MHKTQYSFDLHNSCTLNNSVSIKMFQSLLVFSVFLVEVKVYAKIIPTGFLLSGFPQWYSSDPELKEQSCLLCAPPSPWKNQGRISINIPNGPAGTALPPDS